jgi:hypothetical protein
MRIEIKRGDSGLYIVQVIYFYLGFNHTWYTMVTHNKNNKRMQYLYKIPFGMSR